jgi:hypothetical protein
VTDISTTAPPINAHFPGFSPINKNTYKGINTASNAVICFIAMEYNTNAFYYYYS